MDRTDKKILTLLQQDSSLSNQELADAISLSPSPCLRRVKQLEADGIIENYVAIVNPEKIGLKLTGILFIGLNHHTPEKMRQFETHIKKIPEVMECYLITGQSADYLIKVVVSDMEHYQKILLNRISQIDGVNSIHSSFVMQKVIDKTAMTLDYAPKN